LDQYKLHQDKVTGGIWNTEAESELLQEEQRHQEMHCSSCSRKLNFLKHMLSSPLTNPIFVASPHCHSIAHASVFFFFHLLLLNNPPCRNLKIISTFTHQLAPSLLGALHLPYSFSLKAPYQKESTSLSYAGCLLVVKTLSLIGATKSSVQ